MAGSKIDERWDASKQILVDAAKRAGVDPEIMVKIAGFESKYNSHAQPIAVTKPENNTVQFSVTTKGMGRPDPGTQCD